MRIRINDIVKFRTIDDEIAVGRITGMTALKRCTILEIKSGDKTYCMSSDNPDIIQNLTEDVGERNKNNCLSESLDIIAKCDRCSNNVIITCTQKSNEERLREENERLKKELKEKQEKSLSGFHVKYTLNKSKNSGDDYKDLIIKSLEDLLSAQVEENKLLKHKLNQIANLADCDNKYDVKENMFQAYKFLSHTSNTILNGDNDE